MSELPKEVTSSDKLMNELMVATDASIGVIAIRCHETEVWRVVDDLYALAMTQGNNFRLHTSELGWMEFHKIDPDDSRAPAFDPMEPTEHNLASADVGKAFAQLFESGPNTRASGLPDEGFFVMLDLHYSFGEPKTQTRIRKQAQRALNNEQRLFIIVPYSAEIPDSIAPLMHLIEFEYPTRTELRSSLDDVLSSLDDEDQPDISHDELISILSNGQGMTSNAFETAVAVAITQYSTENDGAEGFSASDIIRSLRTYKMQLLRKTNVLELQPSVPFSEIGGLEQFKEWMHQRRATYSDRAKELGVTPSRGALVVGPPGTGKSLVAKAAGSILNLPVLRFDVARVFNQYVGQSENAMRNVLKMIDAMAPCVLMLDEIDKGFSGMSGGGGDSGTTQRVFGTFLTWMQERDQKTSPVFLIATANRVHGLPPELLRPGRVDERWSVNVPNDEEREAIIRIHLDKRDQELSDKDVALLVSQTANLVGAEIEAIIEDALVLSLNEEEPGVTSELLTTARGNLREMSKTRKEEFEAMAAWAEENARPASAPMQSSTTSADKPRLKRGGGRKLRKR